MKKNRDQPAEAARPLAASGQALRRRAEEKLRERKKKAAPLPATNADTLRLVHELQVHQIELEMQNEELARTRAEAEAALRQYTDLYDFAPVGYFTLARDGAILQVNLAGARLLGVEVGKLIKRRFGVFVSPRSRTTFNAFLEKVFTRGSKEDCEVALLKDESGPLWAQMEASCTDASRGQREVCRAVVRDVTGRKRAEEALREGEEIFSQFMQYSPIYVFFKDETTRSLRLSSNFSKMLGRPIHELLGKTMDDLFPSELAKSMVADDLRILREGKQVEVEEELNGRLYTTIKFPIQSEGRPRYLAGFTMDITERKQAEEQLHLQSAALEIAANAIAVTDVNGVIQWINPAWSALTGYSKEEAVGQTPRILKSGKHDRAFYQNLWGTILAGKVWRGEIVNRRKDSSLYTEEQTITPLLDERGAVKHFIVIQQDITERKQAEETLMQLSVHDALTGLYNRGYFEEAMARLERGRQFPISLAIADVNRLKATNDRLGHAAGDALLKRVARILTAAFRAEDVLARIGGDEFAVLMPGTHAAAAELALRRVRQALQEHNAAHVRTRVSLSLGVSTAEKRRPLADVLKEADARMYREKRERNAS